MLVKCSIKFCRHLVNRKKEKNHKCSKCRSREWRTKNPMKAWLAHIRDRARRKKVPFNLNVVYLTAFVTSQNYNPHLHHLDRIIPPKGYVMGNLQILNIDINISKGNRERNGQYQMY